MRSARHSLSASLSSERVGLSKPAGIADPAAPSHNTVPRLAANTPTLRVEREGAFTSAILHDGVRDFPSRRPSISGASVWHAKRGRWQHRCGESSGLPYWSGQSRRADGFAHRSGAGPARVIGSSSSALAFFPIFCYQEVPQPACRESGRFRTAIKPKEPKTRTNPGVFLDAGRNRTQAVSAV